MALFRMNGAGTEIYYLGDIDFTAYTIQFNVNSKCPDKYKQLNDSNFIIGIKYVHSYSSHRERSGGHNDYITHSYNASTGILTMSGGYSYYHVEGTLENGGKWGHHEDSIRVSVYLVTGKIKSI